MKEKLIAIIEEFGKILTPDECNQYLPKLRDYLIPYIIETKSSGYDINRIFKDEFTRSDLVKSTMFYVIKNENVECLSAIDDYLIAVNRLFEELLFDRFPNPTLMKYKPFTSLNDEVQAELSKEGILLRAREVNPAINNEQYKFIIDYLKNLNSESIKSKQVKIIIKLSLLYGFSHDKIAVMTIADYNASQKTLRIQYDKTTKREIYLELPYSLSQEMNEYLLHRNRKDNLKSELLFVTQNSTKIKNGFLTEVLESMKKQYTEMNSATLEKNYFTPTGLQKYAITQMIFSGINQSVIMDFTGQDEDIYRDCQNDVNRIKMLDRNRYINHMIRGIKTYDEL